MPVWRVRTWMRIGRDMWPTCMLCATCGGDGGCPRCALRPSVSSRGSEWSSGSRRFAVPDRANDRTFVKTGSTVIRPVSSRVIFGGAMFEPLAGACAMTNGGPVPGACLKSPPCSRLLFEGGTRRCERTSRLRRTRRTAGNGDMGRDGTCLRNKRSGKELRRAKASGAQLRMLREKLVNRGLPHGVHCDVARVLLGPSALRIGVRIPMAIADRYLPAAGPYAAGRANLPACAAARGASSVEG
jgi:hypothetical protein